jgi:hypothetical protein
MLSKSRTYQKTVRYCDGTPYLEVEAWLALTSIKQFSFSVIMTSLRTGEEKLDSGRFSRYSDDIQPHLVSIDVRNEWNSYEHLFIERLDWISENVTDLWGFDIDVPHLGINAECSLVFSFKSKSDAMRFKLTF